MIIEEAINNEMIPIYGKGQNIRDWIYVEEHVKAIDKIVRYGTGGEIYNIGGNCELSNLEVVYCILNLLNKPKSLVNIDRGMI